MIRIAEGAARPSHSAQVPAPARDPAPAGPLMPAETPVGRLERVGEEVAEAAAHIDAATCRFLARLRDFDRLFQESGGSLGFASCAAWLSWRIGVTPGTAREKVRVARALGELPKVEEAMARGRLSYSQVRSITRVATADNEDTLLGFAEHATAAQLETLVRGWRGLDRQAEAERDRKRHERRSLSVWPTEDGSWEVRGRLEPEVGVLFRKALELVSEALYRRQRGEGGTKRAAGAASTSTHGPPPLPGPASPSTSHGGSGSSGRPGVRGDDSVGKSPTHLGFLPTSPRDHLPTSRGLSFRDLQSSNEGAPP